MVNFKLFIKLAIITGLVQVCTTLTASNSEQTDVTKIFTPTELEQARKAGISDRELMNGRKCGVSLEEMVKLYLLIKNTPAEVLYDTDQSLNATRVTTFAEMAKVCEIFVPQLTVATNVTKDQQRRLNELMESVDEYPREIQFRYLRTSICAYLKEPLVHETDANSFGMKFIPYMKFRFCKLKNQNVTGTERVNTAKELCCIYKGRDNGSEMKVQSNAFRLSVEKMTAFEKHWNDFETANTSKSFVKLCDFLTATNPSEKC